MKKKIFAGLALLVLLIAAAAYASVSGTFAWDPVNDPRVIGYKLYWGTSTGTYPNSADAHTTNPFALTGLPDNVPLFFAVTAYSVDSESVKSAELAAYTVKATPPTNGTISPAGNTLVAKNGSITYSITPATGYSVKDVLVDGVTVGKVTSYAFASMGACHTISATFETSIPAPTNLRLSMVIAAISNTLFASK